MENNIYQLKGLRFNVKDNNVEINIDEVNVPQDVCLEQLQLLGTIVEKVQACFMEMKPAIMAVIDNNIAGSKRMQDREDRRIEDAIKDRENKLRMNEIKIAELENAIKDRENKLRMNEIKIAAAEARLKALVNEK